MRHRSNGFTIMELMVVVVILAIMAAVAIPSILSYMPRHRMRQAVRDLYADIQSARLRAVKSKENIAINFAPGPNTYTIFIDNGAGGGTIGNATLDGTEEVIKSSGFPTGVNLTSASFAIPGPTTATGYDPRGLLLNNKAGNIVLINAAEGIYKQIVFRPSGNPDVRTSSDGGSTWED